LFLVLYFGGEKWLRRPLPRAMKGVRPLVE
jgi:hypothetical protein